MYLICLISRNMYCPNIFRFRTPEYAARQLRLPPPLQAQLKSKPATTSPPSGNISRARDLQLTQSPGNETRMKFPSAAALLLALGILCLVAETQQFPANFTWPPMPTIPTIPPITDVCFPCWRPQGGTCVFACQFPGFSLPTIVFN